MNGFAPWQERVHDRTALALDSGRLGHALLFCGPARLGKLAVAERLANRLLCTERTVEGGACGACRSCRMFASRSQADPVETRPDGSLAFPQGRSGHPDLLQVSFAINDKARPPKPRTEIVIEQIRRLSEQMTLSAQYGQTKIAIIDPAEAINHAGANALLKTLEEPVPGRYLWLVSAHPSRLSATIRSRCQRIEFRMPPRAEALAWLQNSGRPAALAEEALDAARGHPGLAAEWLQSDALALRRQVATDLDRVATGEAGVVETAQRWAADANADLRLQFAADLAVARTASDLTDPARTRSLTEWFDRANRARELMRTTVRSDLVLVELLRAWRAGESRRTAGQSRG